jgi:TATA-binding protein-associated factor Taf7
LGGTRVLRGYPAVEEQSKKTKTTKAQVEEKNESSDEESKNDEQQQMEQNEEDYSNEESEGEVRKIDHLVFVVHGYEKKKKRIHYALAYLTCFF